MISVAQGPTALGRNYLAMGIASVTPTCNKQTLHPRTDSSSLAFSTRTWNSDLWPSLAYLTPFPLPSSPPWTPTSDLSLGTAGPFAMSDELETPAQPRASRFREHTNTANSIKPPPDELWKDIGIEDMIEKFNEESSAPPKRKGSQKSTTPSDVGAPATAAASEGPFGRFSRAFASVFGSVLGKRKAGNADAVQDKEKQALDERKQAAEQAYEARKIAQEMGLLPTPKVFVRPTATPRSHKCGKLRAPYLDEHAPNRVQSPSTLPQPRHLAPHRSTSPPRKRICRSR
jgi:hypothetical protein